MKIIAKQNARKWVKERLKRHPGLWIVVLANPTDLVVLAIVSEKLKH
jgi:hypothetical protein